jgi:hypothetical protein
MMYGIIGLIVFAVASSLCAIGGYWVASQGERRQHDEWNQ